MKKVLIADTNKASLVITSEKLKDCFQKVQTLVASSVSDLIEQNAIHNGIIDLFIVDESIGQQASKEDSIALLRQANPGAKILHTSRSGWEGEKRPLRQNTVAALSENLIWLKKPFSTDEFIEALKKLGIDTTQILAKKKNHSVFSTRSTLNLRL